MKMNKAITAAQSLIRSAQRIVAFTGAGISTNSGIPDLAGIERILQDDPNFHQNPYTMLDPEFAEQNPALFYHLYRETFFHPQAIPNIAHQYLAKLEQDGKLAAVVTMNIDGLHQLAGNQHVVEYWGDMHRNHCTQCHHSYDWQPTTEQSVPRCPACGGLILPDFVLRRLATYGDAVQSGEKMLRDADLIIIIGTQRRANSFPSNIPKIVINQQHQTVSNRSSVMLTGNATSICQQLMSR
ncbi:SIR2 family NAD-dependent protein deacylase [Schleiferilactobacillus perolens]|uniref:SIR2 family NAD-dependent protein deacylase n=1 Tax=Schleiferilactobacillus perolens TaxID=100468 RepID=UPI0039E82AD6